MCFLHWLPVLLLISRAVLAEYVVPSTWSGTNITASNEDRQAIIAAAIQEAFTLGTSLGADFYSVLAVSDLYNNTTTYKNQVIGYFATATFQGSNNIGVNEGVDAMRAYQVYQDSAMLNLAIQVWEYSRSYTISPGNVASGTIPTKSVNVGKTCSGATLVGGMFWVSDVNDPTLYGANTAMFFALSAYLAEATGNTTYLSAATDSGAFMIDVIQVTSPGNGAASISANASGCGDIWGLGSFRLDHTGWFMEGLAILPGSTTLGQQSVSVDTLRSNIVNITLAANTLCNAPNGVVNTGKGAGDSTIVQGIGALYHALQGPADLLTYIGSFLSVQYNTITSAATTPGSNVYANSWIGPPATFDLTSQMQAVFALVNGAQVNLGGGNNSTANNGTSGTGNGGNSNNSGDPNSSNSESQHKSLIGPIIGAVVGGIAFLIIFALALFLLLKRRQTPQNLHINAIEAPQHRPPPTMPSFSTFSSSNSFPVEKPRYSPLPTSSGDFGQTGGSLTSGALPTPSVAGSGAGSGSGSDADARLEQIPTDNLIQILQSRLQQEGMSERGHAPPAYEAPR